MPGRSMNQRLYQCATPLPLRSRFRYERHTHIGGASVSERTIKLLRLANCPWVFLAQADYGGCCFVPYDILLVLQCRRDRA